MKPWNDPKVVTLTPIATATLMEASNIAQMWRMISERSSITQSITGWLLLDIALILWWNFYRVCTPDQRAARFTIKIAIFMNLLGTGIAVFFRYFYS